MRVLIINNQSDDIYSLLKLCKHYSMAYDVVEPIQLDRVQVNMYDLAILSGGLWFDDPSQHHIHYSAEISFINSVSIPLVGICLGMQIIASAYDAELVQLNDAHRGKRDIVLTELGTKLLRLDKTLPVQERHTIGVVSCPAPFEVLAESEDCLEVIKHRTKPILGVQFHPEKLTKSYNEYLIWETLLSSIGVELGNTKMGPIAAAS